MIKLRIWAAVVGVVMLAGMARATTVVKMDLPALVGESDTIVQGRVAQEYSQWDAQMKLVFTYVNIQVDDPLKGARRQNVVIRQLGGRVGGLNMSVAGMPKFNVGNEVIVFLKSNPEGTYQVVGLNQGKYDIVNDFAVANISGVEVFDSKTRQVSGGAVVNKQPLETFKSQIRRMAQ